MTELPETARRDTRRLLIKGKAGLGNRVLSTLTGITYAAITNRQAIVDWRDGVYAPPSVNAFPLLFRSPLVDTSLAFPETNDVSPKIWNGHLDWTVSSMIATYDRHRFRDPFIYRKYCCDLTRIDQREQLLIYWSYLPKFQKIRRHFSGSLAHLRHATSQAIITDLMPRFLRPLPAIEERVANFAAYNFSRWTIGVHVRHSDRLSPLEKIYSHVENALVDHRHATIFLATDNSAVEDEFRRRYANVVVAPKWLPPPGEAIHYNDKNKNMVEAAADALVDIYLLARTNQFIYPRGSTFSWLARCLGDLPEDRVIDVERYDPRVFVKRVIHHLA
ncbi:MAG: nodulation protein NodZ [Parvibaculum sp.]|uniref:nodulation protein NodZ n=1 Tax=Parvibaculum sp. TaxID=2024848 RepID=UPI0028466139|nr:nodulation protein NodZ [Parvibaculum sp.]MDR3499404.1 nodulation protein NodZ [Parvibaculum sp.]